jgi:hypothetical protein
MFTPSNGRLVRNRGNNAQWIAQAMEVTIPNVSQLIFTFIWRKNINLQLSCEINYHVS